MMLLADALRICTPHLLPASNVGIANVVQGRIMRSAYARTDGRTHEESFAPSEINRCVSDARRETSRSPSAQGHSMTPGCLGCAAEAAAEPLHVDGHTVLGEVLARIVYELRPHVHGNFDIRRTRKDEKRQPIPGRIRRLVHTRDNWRCIWCGSQNNLQLDHRVPWSARGGEGIDNLRTLCGRCNSRRQNSGYSLDLACFQIPHGRACVDCHPERVADSPDVEPIFCIICEHKAVGIPASPGYTEYFRGHAFLEAAR